jgi:predicted amidophosphoribosyltransferase
MAAHGAGPLLGADACVPVPLHWRRQLSRGFNQARELALHLDLPVWPLLRRSRHTRAQVSLHATSRRTNVDQAFVPRHLWFRAPHTRGCSPRWMQPRTAARGAVLVLVDDVMTTGATLEACARVLRAMGAREVRAVTLARVAPPERR